MYRQKAERGGGQRVYDARHPLKFAIAWSMRRRRRPRRELGDERPSDRRKRPRQMHRDLHMPSCARPV